MPTTPAAGDDRQKRWEERVARWIATEASWGVFAGDVWVCPFCGQPGARGKTADEVKPLEVLAHLTRKCGAWKKGEGKPQEVPELRKWARVHTVARQLTHDPACAVRDADARWYDPFTGRRTKVAWPPGHSLDRKTLTSILQLWPREETAEDAPEKLPLETLRTSVKLHALESYRLFAADGVWVSPLTGEPVPTVRIDVRQPAWHRAAIVAAHDHLAAVHARAQAPLTPLPMSHLLRTVRERNEVLHTAKVVRARLRNDPAWWEVEEGETGGGKRWVCPRCRQAVGSVPVDGGWLKEWVAPFPIANHLVRECAGKPAEETPAGVGATADGETGAVTTEVIPAEPKGYTQSILARAKAVQEGMLPRLPTLAEVLLASRYRSCEAVSGDFYDVFRLDDDRLGITIGDVSGHGIHAALVMAAARKSVVIHARREENPHVVLCRVNEDIGPDLLASVFVTIWYGVLEVHTGRLRHVRAGHNPLVIVPADGGPVRRSEPPGMVVGMAPPAIFNRTLKEETVQLAPGDRLFLYTDGLTEAMNPEREELGLEAVEKALFESRESDPDAALTDVEDLLRAFCRGEELDDDVTLLVVDWQGSDRPAQAATEPMPDEGVALTPEEIDVGEVAAAVAGGADPSGAATGETDAEDASPGASAALLSQSWLQDWGHLPDAPEGVPEAELPGEGSLPWATGEGVPDFAPLPLMLDGPIPDLPAEAGFGADVRLEAPPEARDENPFAGDQLP